MQELNKQMIAAEVLTLRRFDNSELAAFNLDVQLSGRVRPENIAFKKALELNLIKEDGSLFDVETLRTACAFEVNDRAAKGQW